MATLVNARTSTTPRPPLLLVALACVAALIVGGAGTLVVAGESGTGVTSVHDAARTELVHRFYAGVNEMLRTGDASALTALLAPDFVAHPARSGLPAGRDGLIATLRALRAASPGTTLVVEAVYAAGNHVAARITVTPGQPAAFLGFPLDDERNVWAATDLFRVTDGVIAEQWGGPQSGALVQPHAEFRIDLAGGSDYEVRLSRRTYESNARQEHEQAVGAVALVGERGSLSVAIEADGATSGDAEERTAALAPGEVLVLAAGTRFTTSNDEREPADVLILALTPWQGTRTWAPAPDVPDGVETETMGWGVMDSLPSTGVARVGYASLAPGAGIPLHVAAGMELVRVESGRLGLIADESVWVLRGLTQGMSVSEATILGERESAVVPPHASVAYRNAGTEPARLLVVTIQASQPGDPAP